MEVRGDSVWERGEARGERVTRGTSGRSERRKKKGKGGSGEGGGETGTLWTQEEEGEKNVLRERDRKG